MVMEPSWVSTTSCNIILTGSVNTPRVLVFLIEINGEGFFKKVIRESIVNIYNVNSCHEHKCFEEWDYYIRTEKDGLSNQDRFGRKSKNCISEKTYWQ
jgi:hypothetical protein